MSDLNDIKNKTLLIILIVIVAVYFGSQKYSEYKVDLAQKDEQIQTMLLSHQKELHDIKNEVGFLRLESEGKVDEIKRQLEAEEAIRKVIESEREVQEQLSQQKISSLEERISLANTSPALSSIISEWQSAVVSVECDFQLSSSGIHYGATGSGVIIKFDDLPVKVLTNRHILQGPTFYNLNSCKVKLPESGSEFSVLIDDIAFSTTEYDWGTLTINSPDENVNNIVSAFPKLCDQKPNLGDEVVVLGYPGIGSKNGVTATEGIISGFDGNYFITSAKVEQGNSGGAAILQKESCLLGIPTFASLGEVESLARILDIWTIVINK
ncbi:trypsin-like peptidase domain-containing protein [Patescibacteria group bacterium]